MDKTETQIREGKRAQVLLNDPLLKQAFEDLLATYKQEIFHTSFADDDKRRSMLEQEDLKKSGDLMKEIVKGQQQFFNEDNTNGQGQTNTPGQTSRTAPK